MKKILSLIAILAMSVSVYAGSSCCGKSVKDAKKAAKFTEYAKNYEAQAKQAEEKGNAKLAASLKACAAAKLKIAKAYASGDNSILNEGCADYKKACAERDKLKGKCGSKKSSCGKKNWDKKLSKPKL